MAFNAISNITIKRVAYIMNMKISALIEEFAVTKLKILTYGFGSHSDI